MDSMWLEAPSKGSDAGDGQRPDFAVLHTDGRLEYGHFGEDRSSLNPLRRHIDGRLGTQGMAWFRAWFSDDFSALPVNRLADRVFQSMGYYHPTGWRGAVVLTMEEDLDAGTGDLPPLTPSAEAALDYLAGARPGALQPE